MKWKRGSTHLAWGYVGKKHVATVRRVANVWCWTAWTGNYVSHGENETEADALQAVESWIDERTKR